VHQTTGKQTGIDVGLKSFYTDSDGNTVDNPRYLRKAEAKLKRLHRRISRKLKRSKNRKKAIKRLAKGSSSVSRRRTDFAGAPNEVLFSLLPGSDLTEAA
jgi:putative transposase